MDYKSYSSVEADWSFRKFFGEGINFIFKLENWLWYACLKQATVTYEPYLQ